MTTIPDKPFKGLKSARAMTPEQKRAVQQWMYGGDDYWAEAERRSHERGEHVLIPGLACHVCREEAPS